MNIFKLFRSEEIELTGQWRGHYGYGSQYSDSVRQKTVTFIVDIVADQNSFKGSIKEDETGIPEIATIEGTLARKRILFTKTYQNRYSLDQTGERFIDKGPQYVRYVGIYDRSKNKFTGFWEIDTKYIFEDGKVKNYTSRGHWEMLRTIPS
jgi:hypothetical protein